jgi:phosphoglycolate phosphatase-like HAD superfamily hydrolase
MGAVGRWLPGAREAIAAFAAHDVVQTVVTGNIRPIAVTKLEVFQLSEHPRPRGRRLRFGWRYPSAAHSPAWQRAQSKYGQVFEADHVVVIGDTPLDVSAARDVGVRVVGVATGTSTENNSW